MWCDLDLTFDLCCSGLDLQNLVWAIIPETVRCKLFCAGTLVGTCRYATSGCDPDLPFSYSDLDPNKMYYTRRLVVVSVY